LTEIFLCICVRNACSCQEIEDASAPAGGLRSVHDALL
jgi:hypothetical protein